jgi:hypothetical protein
MKEPVEEPTEDELASYDEKVQPGLRNLHVDTTMSAVLKKKHCVNARRLKS